jgi:hypothetical protein
VALKTGEPRRRRGRVSFRALVTGYAILLAAATVIDTVIWGWLGLIATGIGGFGLLALLVVTARRRGRGAGS